MQSRIFLDRGRSTVYLPQLEVPQTLYRYQRRMFAFHKNMHSAGCLIGTNAVMQRYADCVVAAYKARESPSPSDSQRAVAALSLSVEAEQLREQLRTKQAELDSLRQRKGQTPTLLPRLRAYPQDSGQIRETRSRVNLTLLASHRDFAFPRYTRGHPKPSGPNPITGLRAHSVLR